MRRTWLSLVTRWSFEHAPWERGLWVFSLRFTGGSLLVRLNGAYGEARAAVLAKAAEVGAAEILLVEG